MLNFEHECTTCGAHNSYKSNGDNHICTECGDTEGLKEINPEDYLETYYCSLTQSSLAPRGYLKILAPSENIARIVAKLKLKEFWAFIYNEEQFDGQVEEYDLYPIEISPIVVKESDTWYWKQKYEEEFGD